jgi:hypothetical protein
VYQSADKYHNGRITKRGSKVARWILTQVAQAASRKKASKLKEFLDLPNIEWVFINRFIFYKDPWMTKNSYRLHWVYNPHGL